MESPPARSSAGTATVVIVHYRAYSDLSASLASIEACDTATDAIVIDHASAPEHLRPLEARFPWVRFIAETANPGFSAAVNRGVRECDSRYVLLLNPDCVLSGPIRQPLMDYLDATRDVGVVGPRLLNHDGSLQPSGRRFPDITTAIGGRRSWLTVKAPGNWFSRRNLIVSSADREPKTVDWVSGACMMIRREAFEQIGGMDEGYFLYWEDVDFCRRLRAAGWRTQWHPGVTATHTGAGSSRATPYAALIAFHRSAFRYYRTHAGWLGRCAIVPVALLLALRLTAALIVTRLAAVRGARRAPATPPASRVV